MKISEIVCLVGGTLGMRPKDIEGECRERCFVNARFIVTHLCALDGYSQSEIGRSMSRKPCTIHHEKVKFGEYYETDENFRKLSDMCENEYLKLKEKENE